MTALSGMFLWLLPLALLPVMIHLLNRLRYQTVRWAAMMFLRTADRDASRRAKIRQWLILAARCLMLLLFLLALARPQSRGRLARFFDGGSNLVVILFDRSASMEQERGGVSGRERALDLVRQGLAEQGPGTRVVWIDSATGEATPLPRGVDLGRLPLVEPTETQADVAAMLRTGLREIARAGVSRAEVWIPTDRQAVSWVASGSDSPDWSEWAEMDAQVTLRVLDVARGEPDAGNRALQLAGGVSRGEEGLKVPLRLLRDREGAETVALQVDAGGLSLQENLRVEGREFLWELELPLESGVERMGATLSLPADTNPADHLVAVSWRRQSTAKVRLEVGAPFVARVARGAVLPKPGEREVVEAGAELDEDTALWIRDGGGALTEEESRWISEGGVLVELPGEDELSEVGEEAGLGVEAWNEQSGVLATVRREPLRMDLVRVRRAAELEAEGGGRVEARLEDGRPLLLRREMGEGAVYTWATLPEPAASNLADGYVWVPVMQRLLGEGRRADRDSGTRELGEWQPREGESWEPVEGEGDPRLHAGRYRNGSREVALNRPAAEDGRQALSVAELEAWAEPLTLTSFEADLEPADAASSRYEYTPLLAWLGLLFLAVESWLLTRNIRRPMRAARTAWRTAS